MNLLAIYPSYSGYELAIGNEENYERKFLSKHSLELESLIAQKEIKAIITPGILPKLEHLNIPIIQVPSQVAVQAQITGTPDLIREPPILGFLFTYLANLAKEKGSNFLIAHLDKEVHLGAVSFGEVLDHTTNPSEGPFSFEQAGGLPFSFLLDLYEEGKNKEEILDKLTRQSGFKGYLNLTSFAELKEADYNEDCLIWRSFIYQVAKELSGLAPVVQGEVDCLILTGELSESETLRAALIKHLGFKAKETVVYPENLIFKALFQFKGGN